MAEVELHPGVPFCSTETLNRIARQQGLCLFGLLGALLLVCQGKGPLRMHLAHGSRAQRDGHATATGMAQRGGDEACGGGSHGHAHDHRDGEALASRGLKLMVVEPEEQPRANGDDGCCCGCVLGARTSPSPRARGTGCRYARPPRQELKKLLQPLPVHDQGPGGVEIMASQAGGEVQNAAVVRTYSDKEKEAVRWASGLKDQDFRRFFHPSSLRLQR